MGIGVLSIISHSTNLTNEKQDRIIDSVSVRKREERKYKNKERGKIMIKIPDVKSHFSKGVSSRKFGTKFWPWLSSKFSLFTKIKSEFSHWRWNFLLPIHDLSGAAGVTHDEMLTI